MKRLFGWLDQRTGWKSLSREALFENIPGGSRWRYVWGSTLTFALMVQVVTGLFLWMAYSPSSQTAWESVYYIQYQMSGGWLLRGIHHFTAQLMTVLLVIHLMQVVIDGAYKAPREMNFLFGVALLVLVLCLSLTGYLLPWDQKGFWATKVSTNILGITPWIGSALQRLVIGGADYGHHTLTRFFALHAGILPGAVILLVIAHIYLFRRHGITPKQPIRRPDEKFWPDQLLKDAVACLVVLGTVLFLIILPRLRESGVPMGAELAAPADPTEPFSAARPEWYFLFLFQFLKYFPGTTEIWGAIVIPSVILLLVCAMPFIGNWRLGHRFNLGVLFTLLCGASLLTYLAKNQDRNDASYQVAVREAERTAARVKALAAGGIPREGALVLLENDALTQGPKLFSRNCASCHRYGGHDGLGFVSSEEQTATDLKGFASREWLTKFLTAEYITSSNCFGGTRFKDGKMARFVTQRVSKFSPEEKADLSKVVAAISAEAHLPAQSKEDASDVAVIEAGRKLFRAEAMRCANCHQFQIPDEDATAPDLTGYGSKGWLTAFVQNPAHERFYGKKNDRMPAFGENDRLAPKQLELIVDWLRGDWARPGEEIAGNQKAE
jgi:ubiquinol-cytochrome c reductase cytochrome b subunit